MTHKRYAAWIGTSHGQPEDERAAEFFRGISTAMGSAFGSSLRNLCLVDIRLTSCTMTMILIEGSRSQDRVGSTRGVMITIPESILRGIIEHAKRERPMECCGILAGKETAVQKAFELKNVEQSPTRYSMTGLEQLSVFEEMEKDSMEMVAVYHSHPHTDAFPSETDVKMAFYPEVFSVIVSLKDPNEPLVRAFRVGKGGIDVETIKVI